MRELSLEEITDIVVDQCNSNTMPDTDVFTAAMVLANVAHRTQTVISEEDFAALVGIAAVLTRRAAETGVYQAVMDEFLGKDQTKQ